MDNENLLQQIEAAREKVRLARQDVGMATDPFSRDCAKRLLLAAQAQLGALQLELYGQAE